MPFILNKSSRPPQRERERRIAGTATQTAIAIGSALSLEAVFVRMARLGDLKASVIAAITLALAAGIIYVVALYLLEHSSQTRAALWVILAGAILFRLTLYPL